MNEKALESFIQSCDEYMIAQEVSTGDMMILGSAILGSAVGTLMYLRKEKKIEKEQKAKALEEEAKKKAELDEWAKRNNIIFTDSTRDKYGKKIQTALYTHLKKFTSSPSFKAKHKDYLGACEITKSEYSKYGVQISDWQYGIDEDAIDNWSKNHPGQEVTDEIYSKASQWYYETLDEGLKFLKETFSNEIKFFGFSINTGDGDEANLYIN